MSRLHIYSGTLDTGEEKESEIEEGQRWPLHNEEMTPERKRENVIPGTATKGEWPETKGSESSCSPDYSCIGRKHTGDESSGSDDGLWDDQGSKRKFSRIDSKDPSSDDGLSDDQGSGYQHTEDPSSDDELWYGQGSNFKDYSIISNDKKQHNENVTRIVKKYLKTNKMPSKSVLLSVFEDYPYHGNKFKYKILYSHDPLYSTQLDKEKSTLVEGLYINKKRSRIKKIEDAKIIIKTISEKIEELKKTFETIWKRRNNGTNNSSFIIVSITLSD